MVASKKPKSITFVSPLGLPLLLDPPESGAGGAERQFFLFGRGLLARAWSVSYITDKKPMAAAGNTVMPVVTASFSFMGGNKLRTLLDWMSLLYAMWRADSYYYVIKTPAYLLVPMFVFTKLYRRKLVFWAQTDFDAYPEIRPKGGLSGFLMNIGIKRADIILAQTDRQVVGFKKNFSKEARQIMSISGDMSGCGCGREEKYIDILWVGNSMENKRYEILLALAKLLPDYTFALAMNKADLGRYAQAGEECKQIDNIEFLGEVNPIKMESWFDKARLLLNTSVREGFPNTFIQAWQHGLPVVSICIDPDDLITKRNLGFVVDKDSKGQSNDAVDQYAGKLLPAVKLLLTDKLLYEELSENAQNYARENHNESILVEKLEQILRTG